MRRMAATLKREVLTQWRYGFYLVSLAVVGLFLVLYHLLPEGLPLDAAQVVPAFLLVSLLTTTFYFPGALVLLERAEGTPSALAVSPLRPWEYLLAKALSLTGLAALESLALVALTVGASFRPLPLLAGMALLGGLYTAAGIAIAAPHERVNSYLPPSIPAVILLTLPLFGLLGWQSPFLYLFPAQPAVSLTRAAFGGTPTWEAVYGLLGGLLWLALSYGWARHRYRRFLMGAAEEGWR